MNLLILGLIILGEDVLGLFVLRFDIQGFVHSWSDRCMICLKFGPSRIGTRTANLF
jgi:hypothetical protein